MKPASELTSAKSHRLQRIQKGRIEKSSTEVENQKVCTRQAPRTNSGRLACLAPSKAASPKPSGTSLDAGSATVDRDVGGQRSSAAAALLHAGPSRRSLATLQPAADSPAVLVGNHRNNTPLLVVTPRGPVHNRGASANPACTPPPVKAVPSRVQQRCRTSPAATDSPNKSAAGPRQPKQCRQQVALAAPSAGGCCSTPEQLATATAAEYERMLAEEPPAYWESRVKNLSEEIEALLLENETLTKEATGLNSKLESLEKQQEEERVLFSLMTELVDYTEYFDDTLQVVQCFAKKELSRLDEQCTPMTYAAESSEGTITNVAAESVESFRTSLATVQPAAFNVKVLEDSNCLSYVGNSEREKTECINKEAHISSASVIAQSRTEQLLPHSNSCEDPELTSASGLCADAAGIPDATNWKALSRTLTLKRDELNIENDMLRFENMELKKKIEETERHLNENKALHPRLEALMDHTLNLANTVLAVKHVMDQP